MTYPSPKVSIITITYNRANLVERSIRSIIAQTHKNWELILVDNGSTDNTKEVLEKYNAPEFEGKIRIFHLKENRKYAGGANFGLDQVQGDWFSFLDDDDQIMPETLETLLKVPVEVNPAINAVNCNCIDTTTKKFSGFGFDKDCYISFEDRIKKATGDFWGITKTELLGDKRLNENILGYESLFWNKIDKIATRYYIHKAMRIWYTDHVGTITKKVSRKNLKLKANTYHYLAMEDEYWENLKAFNKKKFRSKTIKGLFYCSSENDLHTAQKYVQIIWPNSKSWKYKVTSFLINRINPALLRGIFRLLPI